MNLPTRAVTYLSPSEPVNNGDWYFDSATLDHFWVRRRFEVLRRLADSVIRGARNVAEIGCGHGLLQKGIEETYGIGVAGFELNSVALEKNVSTSPLFFYNIHHRNPEFRSRFDLLLLFDVLEHIEDESGFLQSVRFHLADRGTLVINVPAHPWLYSDYDRAAGHVCRYSLPHLVQVAVRSGLKVRAASYWGLPLVPLLLLRKGMRMEHGNGKAGFDAGSPLMNRILHSWACCEPLPQKFLGTSVMGVFEKQDEDKA